ncbi:hypothetical protein SHKM778_24220 [Streptomyces sp. KM77-8]|uniref:Secreted protein n=1 Tax=Streptomyces haneummycinicus TaxID=3074435 RepID=A0AAT9HEY8_9ACTN
MRWLRRMSLLASVTAAVVFGGAAHASAAVPPQNVHWLYTAGGGGAAFFDADLAGYPSSEKVTVCDNKSNGRGVFAVFRGTHPDTGGAMDVYIDDPSNDGHCRSTYGNFFADGYYVYVLVCEHADGASYNCAQARGVA